MADYAYITAHCSSIILSSFGHLLLHKLCWHNDYFIKAQCRQCTFSSFFIETPEKSSHSNNYCNSMFVRSFMDILELALAHACAVVAGLLMMS